MVYVNIFNAIFLWHRDFMVTMNSVAVNSNILCAVTWADVAKACHGVEYLAGQGNLRLPYIIPTKAKCGLSFILNPHFFI